MWRTLTASSPGGVPGVWNAISWMWRCLSDAIASAIDLVLEGLAQDLAADRGPVDVHVQALRP